MISRKPIFQKPSDDNLYPVRNKNGEIETLVNPNIDSALSIDNDSKTNVVYNRYHHLPLEAQRQKLPVFQYRNHILYLMERYQTLVLIGETGCGKSTQVPQYLHEVGHKVCVTQPRITAAVTLATRVAEERGERGVRLGEEVGYAAGMTAERTVDTGIVFMTEGVLLREMFASPLLMQYTCIVLDEVHERSQMTDVLLGLLKKIAKKRKNLKIVISSATMDGEFFKRFFESRDAHGQTDTSVVMSVPGRTYPIEVFYISEPVADYVKATVDTIIKIHENEPFGDVLAFLTSQEEILSALETLQIYAEANNEKNKHRKSFASGIHAADLSILPMYGSLPLHKQIKVFQMAERNVRKVILATNIAETSVTIPGVVYVVDSGFHKLAHYSPQLGVECVCVCGVSAHNAHQRAGRAGRSKPGKCYRLYTEEEFSKLPESVPPEMCRSDLSSALLQLKALGIHNLLRFTFPTPPPAKSLLGGLELLLALRAVDRSGALTAEGHRMAELPLRPMFAKMLCQSGEFGCVDEILSIVSMLQMDSVFVKQYTGKACAAARVSRRNNFEVAEGDIIMYLNIYDSYSRVKGAHNDEKSAKKACKDWCHRMYINYRVMEKACEIRSSLEKLVKGKFNIENKTFEGPDLGSAKCIRIMKCVLSGMFPQAGWLGAAGHYTSVLGAKLFISESSCLYRVQQPTWVAFASVQSAGDRVHMRDLMAIRKEWLLEVAPHYYTEL
ncbi:probable ATP-dependent RNA helicase DHX35 [Zerene cesonia]|uniref:probable ATP-dependent RNA helicase DHX35 n=1 Tax=Zerene cesonia TaxID=33412 RepID=UPI0018E55829|nr:probable ATP-dependent RNA helicase DHX35 [Zerene cesonia]